MAIAKILTCGEARCGFCTRGSLDLRIKFYANCTNTEYEVTFDVSCKTACCIYLLSCKCCDMKYVGKTWNSIRQRFNGHRGHMRSKTESFVMYNHFCGNNGHGITNMVIKPIELCAKKDLIKREKFWIAELNTLFPYGLNTEANFGGISDAYLLVTKNNSNISVYSVFNKHSSTRTGKGGRKRTGNFIQNNFTENFIADQFITEAIRDAELANNFVHNLRSKLVKLDIHSMKKVFLSSIQKISDGKEIGCPSHEYALYIIKDICLFKLKATYSQKRKQPANFIVFKFINKLIQDLNLHKIINDPNITSLFPINSRNFSSPAVSFKRTKSIRTKVLNYRETLQDNNFPDFVCKCDNYNEVFKDQHHGHIITGDLTLIENIQLRELLQKGLNFHEQQPPNKLQTINVIKSGVDAYISKVSRKLKKAVVTFTPWKTELMKCVEGKLDKCRIYDYNKVLANRVNKGDLNRLKEDFVFAPVDKASNNIAIICKRYYIEVMSKEIQESNTFSPVFFDAPEVLDNLKNSNYITSEDKQKLPLLYCTVKMHKTPIGFRHITAGVGTILQNLSIAVGNSLKLLLRIAEKANDYKIKEIDRCILLVDNREKVLRSLEISNKSTNVINKRKSINTWDFSTLYSNIPHGQLLINVNQFIDDIFRCIKDKKYVCSSTNSKRAYFSRSRHIGVKSFDKDQLKEAVKYIVDNSYITYHNVVYRQIIGIPMGTNCAPHLANIYLHQYEYIYLKSMVEKGELQIAKDLGNMYRYQDDCIAINDNDTFSKHYKKIYPAVMILNQTNVSRDKCTFLDLKIAIYRGKFIYNSYDKRNDFKFPIVNYPDLRGNIPSSQSYGVYTSQLVRFVDINGTFRGFIKDVSKMTKSFQKKGFSVTALKRKYLDFCNEYVYKWARYNVDISTSTYLHKLFTN